MYVPNVAAKNMSTVSYTHLDVYKRQVYCFLRFLAVAQILHAVFYTGDGLMTKILTGGNAIANDGVGNFLIVNIAALTGCPLRAGKAGGHADIQLCLSGFGQHQWRYGQAIGAYGFQDVYKRQPYGLRLVRRKKS